MIQAMAGFLAALMTTATTTPVALAASHREAPLIALDPTADLTDVYAFRSWENSDKAVFIMNVIPQQAPASGPNFFNLDDEVLYAFHFDLDQDGKPDDLTIEFTFDTEIRDNSKAGGLNFKDVPISYAGVPPITALDGPGSEGIGLRQKYKVHAMSRSKSGEAVAKAIRTTTRDVNKKPLIAVPSNVGPATMPYYPALAAQGIFELGNGVRVFVGQREETFYIDLGSTFDTLNFRAPPILTLAQDQNDTQNAFGIDDGFEGLNVTTLAVEIPKSLFPKSAVGMYASTSRQKNRKFVSDGRKGDDKSSGEFVQVSRLANPLINEVIIGTGSKDLWNSQDPKDETRFIDFYQNPRLAFLLNALLPRSRRPGATTWLRCSCNTLPRYFQARPGSYPSSCV
jgi:hypothetical protein